MRQLLIPATVILLGIAGRAEAGKCVAVTKGAVVYSLPKKASKAGKVTEPAAGWVVKRKGSWTSVRFEDTYSVGDGMYAAGNTITIWVRKKDTKPAECPQEANFGMVSAREADARQPLYWTNGREALWVPSNRSDLLASTDKRTLHGIDMACVDFTDVEGLAVRLCGEPGIRAAGDIGWQVR